MEPFLLGTDIGTGSVKTVAVDFSGKAICSAQYHYATLSPQPGFSEQDPHIILNAFIQSIRATVLKMGCLPTGISLSSAMHSIMAVNKQGGPLYNLIIWSDSRSAAIAKQLRNAPEGRDIYLATGTPIHSMSPLCKIIWLRQNLPQLFEQAQKFISIKEYIWYRLFGEFTIDHSIASATGLFDSKERNWNPSSLALAGIRPEHLSRPAPTAYTKKGLSEEMASLLSISSATPFCIGASDGCLANLGTHSIGPGMAALTIGTSGAVRIASNKPLADFSIMNFSYILDEQTFICGGAVNNGGNILQWLLKNFLSQEPTPNNYSELFGIIDQVPAGCKGLLFLPYLNSERAPIWDEQSCGLFFGITAEHHQSYFLRAALEGLCFGLYQVLKSIEHLSGPILQINVSGGFVQSGVWMQLLCDILGKKLTVQHTEDASAVGAAYLGLKSFGIVTTDKFLQQENNNPDLYPRQQFAKAYEKNYRIFETLYPALKDSMHLLYDLNQ